MTTTPPRPQRPPAWTHADLAADPHADPEKAGKVRRMFAAIAPSYDLNNRLHSFGRDQAWRRAAVRLADLGPADEVLDVACGTGDLTRLFAKAGAARVVGADFTQPMLDLATAKRDAAGAPADREAYLLADAMHLPFADASFDVVAIAFGLRNVQDPNRALAEFRRVLRPAGRLVVLEFDKPRAAPLRWLNDLYCNKIMPRTAALVAADRSGAYRYLPKSIDTFLDRAALRAALLSAGFDHVEQHPLTFGVCLCTKGVVAAPTTSAAPTS